MGVNEAILDEIEVLRRGFRALMGEERWAAFEENARVFSEPGVLSRDDPNADPHPDASYQNPWLPKWPRLRAQPFHDPANFEWVAEVEARRDEIRAELDAVIDVEGCFLRGPYDDFVGDPWRVFYLFKDGHRVDENCELCPKTAALADRLPINRSHCGFSRLKPAGRLSEHVGPWNAALTCHLGLLNASRCYVRAGREDGRYQDGKCIIFDDSFIHRVHNRSREPRYTFMFTFWHPDLTSIERAAIQATFAGFGQ